jgi:hypothetical protein
VLVPLVEQADVAVVVVADVAVEVAAVAEEGK